MDAYPQTRTWPYVALVLLLFLVAIASPTWWRDWQMRRAAAIPHAGWSDSSHENGQRRRESADEARRVQIDFRPQWLIRQARQHDAEHRAAAATARTQSGEVSSAPSEPMLHRQSLNGPVARQVETPSDAAAVAEPSVETQAASIEAPQPDPAAAVSAMVSQTSPAEQRLGASDVLVEESTFDVETAFELSASDADDMASILPDEDPLLSHQAEQGDWGGRRSPWPEPKTLRAKLGRLDPQTAQVATWVSLVADSLAELQSQPDLEHPAVGALLTQLSSLVESAPSLEVHLPEAERVLLRQIAYAIARRVAVWEQAHQFAKTSRAAPQQQPAARDAVRVLQDVEQRLMQHAYASAWRRYLQLDRLMQVASEDWNADPAARRETARQVLDRVRDPELTDEQQSFLDHDVFAAFTAQLQSWAVPEPDLPAMLLTLEHFESTRSSSAAERLVNQMNALAYSPLPAARDLREALNLHYRNANIRVTVSGRLMNDLLPVLEPIQQRIEDNILGADVVGRNQTWTDLNVDLVRDDDRIRLRIEADGTSRSRTVSSKGPVRFLTRDDARFNAGKEVIFSPEGIFVSRATAEANNQSQLLGIESDYDQIPFLGWIVRQIALDEHRENRPLLRREVRQRLRKRATRQLDSSIHEKLAGAEDRIDKKLLQPLRNLQLDPHAIEMRSTEQRVVMRLRLAGPTQLAAYTPRPRAMANNVLSFQLHESATNNLLDKVELAGASFELEALVAKLSEELGLERRDIHDELPEGVHVHLGNERPIQFRFADDRVLVIIKIQQLTTPKRTYRNFIVQGRYRADVGQTHVDLQRDGGIELISEKIGFRDQIALRGIFTKVMTRDHRLNIVQGRVKESAELRKLGVTQFVVRDGWIGVSVGPLRQDRVARQE